MIVFHLGALLLIFFGYLRCFIPEYGKNRFSEVVFILLMAGESGALLQRLHWGYAIDFIKLPYWPCFNLNDAYVVIGAIGTILLFFLPQWHVKKKIQ